MIRGAWSMTATRRQPEVRVTHDLAGLTDLDAEPSYFGASLPVAVERAEGLLVEHLQTAGQVVFRCRRGSSRAALER